MFRNLITSFGTGEVILEWIEYAALAIEVLAVAIIVVFIFSSIIHYFISGIRHPEEQLQQYKKLKYNLGRTLLLGLEILVAADIVRTVALESTLESVAILGLLVLVRTFLSWALIVEIEGHWPWQAGVSVERSEEESL
jgi:uncharacterized membrane protein